MISFDEFITQDSWARIVDLFVACLPIDTLGFKHQHASQSRPPYNPTDLLKLSLYGYKNQLRASRKLAHSCQVNMEDKIGSLEKGKYADFIILDKNPLTVQTDKLSTIKCLKTYINGNLTNY